MAGSSEETVLHREVSGCSGRRWTRSCAVVRARRVAPELLLGISTHNRDEIVAANQSAADYINKPFGPADLAPFTAVYEDLSGWSEEVSGARQPADLPAAARAYIDRISELTGVPVSLVSVGPERSQIIRL